jgi:hypothetical protein
LVYYISLRSYFQNLNGLIIPMFLRARDLLPKLDCPKHAFRYLAIELFFFLFKISNGWQQMDQTWLGFADVYLLFVIIDQILGLVQQSTSQMASRREITQPTSRTRPTTIIFATNGSSQSSAAAAATATATATATTTTTANQCCGTSSQLPAQCFSFR